MKVKVAFTLDVDEQDWADDYGIEPSAVPADVQSLMESNCRELLERLGLGVAS
ncbi:hypothetical protein [Mycobacteroides abscessus]|uniref:hypothetical protein n=1 Tax=Mycobacteroides abscessus TaxID=36809 RepID=UPI0002D899BA|nr:hypothetical protein [Mycobacteroides abscessus]